MRQSKSLGSLGTLSIGGARRSNGATAAPPSAVEYPASADAYELLQDCGRGVSATVWEARVRATGELVAIKALNLEALASPLEDIMHEAQTMKAYKHEAILPLYVSFVTGEELWLVMPFMAGGSVAHIMRYAHPDGLCETVIATIMREVLRALAYIHAHGGIHRDVKAGNVLVDAAGRVRLGDFGVAATLERTGDWGGATNLRRTFVGTPCWMAPEVLEQSAGYGSPADIWSAGITLLELAHGHAPFSKLPPMKVLLMTLQGPPPQLEASCGGRHFSRGMREVVARCLNKDPSKRPSAKELLEHRFFKQARDADYVKRTLLAGLPPLPQRCTEIRLGKAATLARENDRAALASHISYVTDVAQWDFRCVAPEPQAAPGAAAQAAAAAGTVADVASSADADTSARAQPAGAGGRGDQCSVCQQPLSPPQQPAPAAQPQLGSRDAVHAQCAPALPAASVQQQHSPVKQLQPAADTGPGTRDTHASTGGGGGAPLVPATQGEAAAASAASAAAAAGPAGSGRCITCWAGDRRITSFPVSVPDTPDHSPMNSRPGTPRQSGGGGAAADAADAPLEGGAAAPRPSSPLPAAAKRHGRFTIVEGPAPYEGPELSCADAAGAAGASDVAAAVGRGGGADQAGAAGGSGPPGAVRQRSMSSPDMSTCSAAAAAAQPLQRQHAAPRVAVAPPPGSPASPVASPIAGGGTPRASGGGNLIARLLQQRSPPRAEIAAAAATAAAGPGSAPQLQHGSAGKLDRPTSGSCGGGGTDAGAAASCSLSRPAAALSVIYAADAGDAGATAPRGGHGKEHHTAAQVWENVKEDVAHLFKALGGHGSRSSSLSPRRQRPPLEQQQPTSPQSPQPAPQLHAAGGSGIVGASVPAAAGGSCTKPPRYQPSQAGARRSSSSCEQHQQPSPQQQHPAAPADALPNGLAAHEPSFSSQLLPPGAAGVAAPDSSGTATQLAAAAGATDSAAAEPQQQQLAQPQQPPPAPAPQQQLVESGPVLVAPPPFSGAPAAGLEAGGPLPAKARPASPSPFAAPAAACAALSAAAAEQGRPAEPSPHRRQRGRFTVTET